MDYIEFRRHLGKAGLRVKDFAELTQLSPNSITNYAQKGVVPNHLAIISALLGEMVEYKIDYRDVLSRIEVNQNKSRGSGFGSKNRKSKNEGLS